MNFTQQNAPTLGICGIFHEILGEFPDFKSSISNSLTFPVFPGQWTP